MSKLDETMKTFDAACEAESNAVVALQTALEDQRKLEISGKDTVEQINAAEATLSNAKVDMESAAIVLREQVDNQTFGRPHTREQAWAAYTKARDAVGEAKRVYNTLVEKTLGFQDAIKAGEKVITQARESLARAERHRGSVAEALRPLIASEVAGHTGKSMRKPTDTQEQDATA